MMNIGNLSKTEFNVLIDALDQYVCDLEDIEGMDYERTLRPQNTHKKDGKR
jgi:hypothetical protein